MKVKKSVSVLEPRTKTDILLTCVVGQCLDSVCGPLVPPGWSLVALRFALTGVWPVVWLWDLLEICIECNNAIKIFF